MKLNIVTACSRPQNLLRIQRSIQEVFSRSTHTYEWIIVLDSNKIATGYEIPLKGEEHTDFKILKFVNNTNLGEPLKNFGLFFIPEGEYVYILDDDTLLHPSIIDVLDTLAVTYKDGAVFQQLMRSEENHEQFVIRRINITVNFIDQGQYIWKMKNGDKIPEQYNGDGHFIVSRYNPATWETLYYPASFYNYLR